MKVYMTYELTGGSSIIAKHIIPISFGCRCYRCGKSAQIRAELFKYLRRTIVEPGIMLFGNDEGVTMAKRTDIQEHKYIVVLKNSVAWDRTRYDLTENTFVPTHLIPHANPLK